MIQIRWFVVAIAVGLSSGCTIVTPKPNIVDVDDGGDDGPQAACACARPPLCSDGIVLASSLPIDRRDTIATVQPGGGSGSCGAEEPGPGLDYRWTAPASDEYVVVVTPSFDAVVTMRANDCGGALACTAAGASRAGAMTVPLQAGESIGIAVSAVGSGSGDVRLQIFANRSVCGDATCEAGETCSSCGIDCGKCPVCGNGVCEPSENATTCAPDCAPI